MLVVLSKSPFLNGYDSILETAAKVVEKGEKVAVLFIQDACLAATMNEYCDKLLKNKIEVYALKADCEARGLLEKVGKDVKIIEYRDWVKLVMDTHNKIISWT